MVIFVMWMLQFITGQQHQSLMEHCVILVILRGYHGDLNETCFVGEVSERVKSLVANTWECLEKAIEMVKPGTKYRDVGNVIQKHASSAGYSVVRSYCGHGIHKYERKEEEKGLTFFLSDCFTVLRTFLTTPRTRLWV